jgi:hypothetical protein
MKATAEPTPLIFSWAKRPRFAAFLPSFLVLSLLAHIGTFFVFRVVYPERVSIPAPPPEVVLLTPHGPENQALLRWIESEEPALIASSVRSADEPILAVKYRPSFETLRTMPRPAVTNATEVQFPPAKPPLDLIRSAAQRHEQPAVAIKPLPTKLFFGGALAARPVAKEPPFEIVSKSSVPLEPTEFLLGVSGMGEVSYTFLQRSCGVPALDLAAAEHLERISFEAREDETAWGMARVSWGDDAYNPPQSR